MKTITNQKRNNLKPTALMLVLGAASLAATLIASTAWAVLPVLPPPTPNLPLNRIVVPEPVDYLQYVKNRAAAIKLGKAFFWDMQTGSDGIVACATCHFHAGVDNRMKNTVNPGPNGKFDVVSGSNQTLQPADFPFHERADNPDLQSSTVVRDSDDIVGSQGVIKKSFAGISIGSPFDAGTLVTDPTFSFQGENMRQVTGRQAPSVINAVFNFANFWDGRANNIFNGENPFGPADPNAGIWSNRTGALFKEKITIRNASLASQATGPPLSDVEMSWAGRTFPELGRKLLSLTPLGQQTVHPGDSVLGPLSRGFSAKGLNATYEQMIKDAFQDYLWNSTEAVSLPTVAHPEGEPFSQMEANFSFFWGLAIQSYEATLVSDQTPFDRYLGGDTTALTAEQTWGFDIFFGVGVCFECHSSTELTKASVDSAQFESDALNEMVQFMFLGNGFPGIYDQGFYNIGYRPTSQDIGRGGTAPFLNRLTFQNFPLSWSRLAKLQKQGLMPFSTPQLPAFVAADIRTDVDGAFKTPALRNIELTGPYFHTGGSLTLDHVMEFYNRGGNFPTENVDNLHPAITQLDFLVFTPGADQALHSFLMALTDERVRNESAPFDHPELLIPEGAPQVLTRLPARDASGNAAPDPTVTLNPVATPTNKTSQLISGTLMSGATVTVSVNTAAVVNNLVITGTSWSATVTGLAEGANVITVTGIDPSNVATVITATIALDTVAPALTLNAVTSPTRNDFQTMSGTVEPGVTPIISTNPSAVVGAITVSGGNWSAQISGLKKGINTVTVTAVDRVGNTATQTATIVMNAPVVLTIDSFSSTARNADQTISGTVEAGVTPTVSASAPALVGPVTTSGTTWTCRIYDLAKGDNTIMVTASDGAGNFVTKTVTIKIVVADGCFRGTGNPDISDALKALRMAVGIAAPTSDDLMHGDVNLDNKIDSGDALLILRKVVGMASF